MNAEVPRWPPIERLLSRLPSEIVVGAMERKRVEVVLRAVGAPTEAGAFEAWVEEDRERLVRLVVSVVGMAATHPTLVREAVGAWWKEERERAQGEAGRRIDWQADDDLGVEGSVEDGDEAARGASFRVAVVFGLAAALLVAAMWGLGLFEPPPVETDATASGRGTSDGGDETETETGAESTSDTGETGGESTSDDGPVPPTPMNVDLSEVYVRVPIATLEVEYGDGPIPWLPLSIAVLAALAFVGLLRAKLPRGLLPGPPDEAPRATRVGRVPPRGRPLRRVLLDRNARDALVWGIAREATERETEDVDVMRSVDATIETGLPTLRFVPASEYRGVWIWRDTEMNDEHARMALRLQGELKDTLRDAGLPVQVAQFDGLPAILCMGRRSFSASALLGVGRPPRVVVLTDAARMVRRLRDASTRSRAEATIRLLRQWEGLALVDFEGPRSDLAALAHAWHVGRIAPEHAAAHLAGQAPRQGHPVASRELLRWEAVCVVVPRAVTEDEVQRVRRALGLEASAFEIDELRARASSGRGGGWLQWSGSARAEVFGRYDRAYGYRERWGAEEDCGARLLKRALGHWEAIYDRAIAGRKADDDSDTAAYLEVERAVVQLWLRPDEAARELYRWWQTDEFRGVVGELVAQHSDRDGSAELVRLPWRYDDRDAEAKLLLGRMGLEVRRKETRLRLGGRRKLGLGIALGVMVGALGVAVVEGEGEEPKIEMVGKAPRGAEVECEVRSGMFADEVECEVRSRIPQEKLSRGGLRRWGAAASVEVSWTMERRACAGELAGGLRYVMCDDEGRMVRQEQGWLGWSRAVVASADGEELARWLVALGSVDYAVYGGVDAAGVLQGAGQRLVIVGEGDDFEGVDGLAVVVRVPEGSRPDLDFAGVRGLEEAWPEAKVVRGRASDFEFVGLDESCPEDMRFIQGGRFDEHVISSLCMDVTEVTVAEYQRCVERGKCTEARAGGYCNAGQEGREMHPINCVDWEQSRVFCETRDKELPTSEEWEWAARGREKGWTYPWGEEEPTCERVVMEGEGEDGCGKDRTWVVGSKQKGNSRDGLQDMAGNVWEWTSSKSGDGRIVRGGSWISDYPGYFRASSRDVYFPSDRIGIIGFRCARTSSGMQ